MTWIRSRAWLCATLGLIASVSPRLADAQLAPTGGHYAGRPSDTGHEPGSVNASGGYAAAVPLDLPAARGGLPVPVQITYGARGVGAAGLGWEVPLSYVRRDATFAHRRPRFGSDSVPQPRVQVSVSLGGRALDLVPKGAAWVARHDAPDLLLREQNSTSWVMYDGQGRTWLFTEPPALAGAGLWLLSSISGPGGTRVQLLYTIGTPALPGGCGVSIDLARVMYNTHPNTSCAKHEVTLRYGAAATSPLALSMLGDRVLARLRTLRAIEVKSRATCDSPTERLRLYELSYLPDADTQQPRLRSVQMFGRQGTPEQHIAVPVASYRYGSATNAGKLRYQKTQAIGLPAGADSTKISSTDADNTVVAPIPGLKGYATWQSLTDLSGDGRPDLVFAQNGKLWVARNRPAAGGSTILGDTQSIGQLADSSFATGALETRAATNNRFTYGADHRNVDKVWRQAIDVNGDGRIDVIDAAEEAGEWIIYLNTPGAGPSEVRWERRSYSIARLYHHLWLRGHDLSNNYLPLASRFTARDRIVGACWIFNGTSWVDFPQGWSNGACGSAFPQGLLSVGPEVTYTEWEVTDINGDGYVDMVFNSSRVDLWPMGGPKRTGRLNETANTQHLFKVQPKDADANKVNAVLNLRGVVFDSGLNPFSAPVDLRTNTSCGVGLWAETFGTQHVVCSIDDVNGDGLADRVERSFDVFLGTGRGFSTVKLTLPGALATQESNQVQLCKAPAPGSTTYGVGQSGGLHDLTGDSIPDFVERSPLGGWRVSIGTGAGFAAPVDIEVVGSGFTFSAQTERCDGKVSKTTSGLYDIDGDGKPEVVRIAGRGLLDVYQLAGGAVPRTPEAGRLIEVSNGYGAKTTIGYRSAKEDGLTRHQVPFPEIVVTSMATTGTAGLGGSLSKIHYAYGGAELIYDSAIDAFTLPAYGRSIALIVLAVSGRTDGLSTFTIPLADLLARTDDVPQGRAYGLATVTDTYPLAPFVSTPKNERFGRYLKAGRVRDVTVLNGAIDADPWAMLAVDIGTDPRRVGSTHYDWAAKLFEEPAVAGTVVQDCVEMMYPYDFIASLAANPGFYDTCSAHGFVHARAAASWRGQAAPPSTSNVATRSEATDVDDYGRAITVVQQKDLHRSDDDICIETKYATPIGQNERVLSAPSSRRIWDCRSRTGAFTTYAARSWSYDGLPNGRVAQGFVTSHTIERRNTATGALLNVVRAFDVSYDLAGNPVTITRTREDGAVRTLTLTYDPFGLAPARSRTDATGTPSLEATVARDAVSLDALAVTDVHQTRWGLDYDGFGRTVRSTVTPPGGSPGVLSTSSYLGFSGTDPLGRRVVDTSFSDPVAPGNVGAAVGRTTTVFLDELGRARRTELALGTDYANEVLIAGARSYDGLGRVAFEADVFPASQNAATAYGTTYFYRLDGFPSCFVRGHGRQLPTRVTDEASERYPICFTRSFANHQETLGVSDPASLLASSAQAGVARLATLTAVGRVLSRATWKDGKRLELATFTHDRLGQLTGIARYQDPTLELNPVRTTWSLDSIGQVLTWQEPEGAPQLTRYSDWGESLEVRWTDTTVSPNVDRRVVSRYDALGRLTHREERNNGVTDPDTVNDYLYDFGVSAAPEVTPRNVLGRLAQAKAPNGNVFYSYDAFGEVEARTFTDDQGGRYVEKTLFHADGTAAALELYLPDTGFKPERVDYAYDSAARLRSARFSDGSTSLDLYRAAEIDAFGRVRKAKYGGAVDYAASYADLGRRLMNEVTVSSQAGSRRILYLGYDPLGREKVRREIRDGEASGPKTNIGYDALGRLSIVLKTDGAVALSHRQFSYDALGNVLRLVDALGADDAALSYRAIDRDRVCRIGYGNGGLGGTTACNVLHDSAGNIVEQATRTGVRRLSYFASGNVRSITEASAQAVFRYDAFGNVQELDLQGAGIADARKDRRFGGLIELREQMIGGSPAAVISRNIPGAGGIVATRRGATQEWVFRFGEERGNRFFTDAAGAFVQEVDYQPFGEAKSTGAQPGSAQYTTAQWNGGDALAAFGISHLGARLYDPLIGRFLSRDPLLVPRTSATTNPYAFAMNDPLNLSDPRGWDSGCIGRECEGPAGNGFPGGGGGPSDINNPCRYLSCAGPDDTGGANPQSTYRPPTPTTFSSAPTGPQTARGKALKQEVEDRAGFTMSDTFNFDTLAATGLSIDAVMERIEQTPDAHAAVDRYNAKLNSVASFFAGFGDSVLFWCPGCTANARRQWGIKSGDADEWAYGVGSFTGLVGSIVAPRPTSVIAPPGAYAPTRPAVPFPGWDPTVPPGPDFVWRGKPPQGGRQGNWHNLNTGESWHPDLQHPAPIGPHWDYKDPSGNWWRVDPSGKVTSK